MRYITSTELQNWHNTRQSEEKLPLLLRRVIVNLLEFKNINFIDIPGGDSIWKPGADGKIIPKIDNAILNEANRTYIVECGQSTDANSKFKADFQKRTKELNGVETKSIFVFITTHKFRDKQDVIENIKREVEGSNLWAGIKIYDADDIETWLENDPATTAWLANILEKPTIGIRGFDYIWDSWLKSTTIPLDEDVILARAKTNLPYINDWLRKDGELLGIKASSNYESLLFFMASVIKSDLSFEVKDAIKNKIVIVEDENTWNQIVDNGESKKLILIPTFGVPKNLAAKIDGGLKIFIPLGEDDIGSTVKDIIQVGALNTEVLYPILEAKTKSYERANYLISHLGQSGSILHLQRLLERPEAMLPKPKWVSKDNWDVLVILALVGKWQDNNEKDREIITNLFGLEYAEIIRRISLYIKTEEAPVIHNGNTWEVLNPELIIEYLGGYLTQEIFDRFLNYTEKVFSTVNSKYKLPKEKRIFSTIYITDPDSKIYSEDLKRGLAQGLAILNVKSSTFNVALNIEPKIRNLVINVLKNKDWYVWASLTNCFTLFAEASPDGFLFALEETIKETPNTIKDIYTQSINDGVFGSSCLYSDILWALEILAWSDKWFSRSVNLLLTLESLKTMDTKWGNTPLESLSKIFCPWMQGTSVSLENRKQFLNTLINSNNHVGLVFDLMQLLYHMQTCTPTCRPKFSWCDILNNEIKRDEVQTFYRFLFEKSIAILGDDINRWDNILRNITKMQEQEFEFLITKLVELDWTNASQEFKTFIYKNLTNWIMFNDRMDEETKAKWGYDVKAPKLKGIIEKINISNPLDKYAYMFSSEMGWHYRNLDGKPNVELQHAIKAVFSFGGVGALLSFAEQIDNPDLLGWESGYIDFAQEDISGILTQGNTNNEKIRNFEAAFFVSVFNFRGKEYVDRIYNNSWSDDYKKILLCSIRKGREYWDWLNEKGQADLYWKNVQSIYTSSDEEYEFAMQKLRQTDNYACMFHLIIMQKYGSRVDKIKTDDIIFILKGALEKQDVIRDVISSHHLPDLFKILQDRVDIDVEMDVLFQLELAYFPLFDDYCSLQPIAIEHRLRTDPEFFLEIIQATFTKKEDLINKTKEEQQQAENTAHLALKLYMKMDKMFPFQGEENLNNWMNGADILIERISDANIKRCAKQKIGSMLSANTLVDKDDNVWPVKYVRNIIEKFYDKDLRDGFVIGKFNSLGVRTVDTKNPDQYWIEKAAKYKHDADKIRFSYPYTAQILDSMAEDYGREAERAKIEF
ncbi:MAG: hypothetical protein J6Y03_03085 [Alphaproteobacteria bacterium]|nr:hypothetical protein [Alphaproteobacteria bacterium]